MHRVVGALWMSSRWSYHACGECVKEGGETDEWIDKAGSIGIMKEIGGSTKLLIRDM